MTQPVLPPMLRDGPSPPQPPRSRGIADVRDRWWFLAAWAIALAVFAASSPGRIFFDTKLGVDISPAEFYARLWSLWDPLEWFGTLQNQYIGYAIPMLPFYLAGQLLHIPVWLTERLWLSLLVATGFTGMEKLARALRVGTPGSRLLAGAVYALWPTFTVVLGSTSATALPGMLLPWTVLPLVPAVQGRSGVIRASARSGVAVALMSGVNATATLAVLVLPALYILLKTTGWHRVRLFLGWTCAVVAGCVWWLVPLLLQGRYSFNFLPYIEQTATTAKTLSAAAVLRGSGTWTAYFDLGGPPWLRSGWVMVTSSAAILASAVAATTGLYGLARRDMPERRWLTISVGVTALIILSGYFGPLSGPLHTQVDSLLDGPLAPLRSTYKFESVIAAALALGCAHALARLWRFTESLSGAVRAISTLPLAGLALAGLALPQLTGQMVQGSFTQVPGYWYQAADYLAAHAPRQTAMVVPADPHGQFLWGDTTDDPLEPLASSPWVERGIVPYGGAGSQQLLNTIESAVESDQEVPGLAAYLDRAGLRYLVIRNDLVPGMLGYTPPQYVNETLALSGFQQVAAFGPRIPAAGGVYQQVPGLVPGEATSYPAVQIFQATGAALRPAGPVSTLPVSKTVLVNGGADSLLQLDGQGALGISSPAVLAGDTLTSPPATWAVTDGQRRADDAFSLTQDYLSFTYTATEDNPPDDSLGDAGDPPRQLLPVPAAGHQTTAVLSGAASVTASSYGSWLTDEPQYDPVNAFDGNPGTAWAEGDAETPVGQWIQIDFNQPIDLPSSIGIQLLDDSDLRSMASQLTVSTAAGVAGTNMAGTGSLQPLSVAPGLTSWLRITIAHATNVIAGEPGAGISDVLIPGVTATKYLQPAQDPAGQAAPTVTYSFQQQVQSPYQLSTQSTGQPLARTFTTSAAEQLRLTASAMPVPGVGLYDLLVHLIKARHTPPSDSTPIRLDCGQGPTVTVNGQQYQTAISGTFGDLAQRRPVSVRLCTPDGTVYLSPGQQWLLAEPTDDFTVTELNLTGPSSLSSAAVTASSPARPVQILKWQPDNRSLRIGAGAASYLEIHENFDAGWVATLNGKRLTPAILDGWQQAFVVPAGQGGTITLSFGPAPIYHVAIIGSALILLIVLAIAIGIRRNQPAPPSTALALTPVRGPGPETVRRRLLRQGLLLIPVAVVILLAGGPIVIAVPVLGAVAWWRPGWLPLTAVLAMLGAGVTAATSAHPGQLGSGTFSGLAQACALIALAAVLMPVPRRPAIRRDQVRDQPEDAP